MKTTSCKIEEQEKEVWSKPEIALISINNETLSLADDAKKLAHFLFIS